MTSLPVLQKYGEVFLLFDNHFTKGRFGFKLTAPYDETRRKAASELAKKNTERLRRQEQ